MNTEYLQRGDVGIAPYGSLFIYSQRRDRTPPYERR